MPELQRAELASDRGFEEACRLGARRRQQARAFCVPRSRALNLAFHGRDGRASGSQQRELGFVLGPETVERIHADMVFARDGAQREEPLLDALQLPGLAFETREQCAQLLAALLNER